MSEQNGCTYTSPTVKPGDHGNENGVFGLSVCPVCNGLPDYQRPTPEQIIGRWDRQSKVMAGWITDSLARHGYRIEHDTDRRARDEAIMRATLAELVNAGDYPSIIMADDIDRIIAAVDEDTP